MLSFLQSEKVVRLTMLKTSSLFKVSSCCSTDCIVNVPWALLYIQTKLPSVGLILNIQMCSSINVMSYCNKCAFGLHLLSYTLILNIFYAFVRKLMATLPFSRSSLSKEDCAANTNFYTS